MSSYDLYLVSIANFSYEISGASTDTARQYWFMVLGGPDEVIFAVEDCVGGFAVEFHCSTLPS